MSDQIEKDIERCMAEESELVQSIAKLEQEFRERTGAKSVLEIQLKRLRYRHRNVKWVEMVATLTGLPNSVVEVVLRPYALILFLELPMYTILNDVDHQFHLDPSSSNCCLEVRPRPPSEYLRGHIPEKWDRGYRVAKLSWWCTLFLSDNDELLLLEQMVHSELTPKKPSSTKHCNNDSKIAEYIIADGLKIGTVTVENRCAMKFLQFSCENLFCLFQSLIARS
jgi:hypothetical protein